MIKNKSFLILVFVGAFALLGYFREFFFGNYNNVMYLLYNRESTVPVNENFHYFLGLSYNTAYYLKYIFTLAFFAAFFALSFICIKIFMADKKILKWFTYSYLLLLLLSSVLMLWTYFFKTNFESDEYSVSRWLMGIAQSPLPLLFFLATSKLNKKLN